MLQPALPTVFLITIIVFGTIGNAITAKCFVDAKSRPLNTNAVQTVNTECSTKADKSWALVGRNDWGMLRIRFICQRSRHITGSGQQRFHLKKSTVFAGFWICLRPKQPETNGLLTLLIVMQLLLGWPITSGEFDNHSVAIRQIGFHAFLSKILAASTEVNIGCRWIALCSSPLATRWSDNGRGPTFIGHLLLFCQHIVTITVQQMQWCSITFRWKDFMNIIY